MSRGITEARIRIDQIDQRLRELQPLELERKALVEFIRTSIAMLEQFELGRALDERGMRKVEAIDMPSQGILSSSEDERLWKLVQTVMGMRQEPMTAQEVLVALETQRIQIKGAHPREQVRSAMIRREDRFERVGRGLFALKEWSADIKRRRSVLPEAEDGPPEAEDDLSLDLLVSDISSQVLS